MTATRHSAMTFLVFSVITISTLLNLAGMTWAQQASPSAQPHADDGSARRGKNSSYTWPIQVTFDVVTYYEVFGTFRNIALDQSTPYVVEYTAAGCGDGKGSSQCACSLDNKYCLIQGQVKISPSGFGLDHVTFNRLREDTKYNIDVKLPSGWVYTTSVLTLPLAPAESDGDKFTATAIAHSSTSIIVTITISSSSSFATSGIFDIVFKANNCHAPSGCPCNGYTCLLDGKSDITTSGSGMSSVKIDNLRKYTSYSVNIQSTLRSERSKPVELDVTTLPGNPSQPQDLRAAVQ
eukprot:scpid91281/ scgid8333/ 